MNKRDFVAEMRDALIEENKKKNKVNKSKKKKRKTK